MKIFFGVGGQELFFVIFYLKKIQGRCIYQKKVLPLRLDYVRIQTKL